MYEKLDNKQEIDNEKKKIILTDDKKRQIGEIIFQKTIKNESLENFSIQEMIYALRIYKYFNEKNLIENYENNYNNLKNHLILQIKNSEYVFLTIDRKLKYPFINMGRMDIYSNEMIAQEAIQHYSEQHRKLDIKKVAIKAKVDKLQIDLSSYLYYMGIGPIRVDMGRYSTELNLNEIFDNEYQTEQTLVNPKLRFAMIDFLEEINWKGNFKGKQEIVIEKENRMLSEIKKGRYIIPVQLSEREDTVNNNNSIDLEDSVNFSRLKSSNGEFYAPIFTDWTEFKKKYSKNGWNGLIVSYNELKNFCKNFSGVVINPLGEKISINKENLNKCDNH